MEFNVGFALFRNDWTSMNNMSLIEDYVYWEASINSFEFKDGASVQHKTILSMGPCSLDNFYEPYGPLKGYL